MESDPNKDMGLYHQQGSGGLLSGRCEGGKIAMWSLPKADSFFAAATIKVRANSNTTVPCIRWDFSIF